MFLSRRCSFSVELLLCGPVSANIFTGSESYVINSRGKREEIHQSL